MRLIHKGATSQSLYVEVLDSASTTGGRKTGIVYNSAGLTGYYVRNGAAATAITLATLAAANSAWSSGGFKEVDATNMPGVYRVDVPDAAFASGVDSVVVTLKGAAGMVQVSEEVQLTGIDAQDTVRAALTALPNAAAEAAGGLYTRGSGAGQINQNNNGNVDVNAVRINAVATTSVTTINANVGTTQPENFTGTGASALVKADAIDLAGTALTGRDIGASVLLSAGTGTGQLDFTSGVVKANLAQILGTALTETAGQIAAAFKKVFDVATPVFTAQSVNQTGDNYARLGAPAGASIAADLAEIEVETDTIGTDTAGVTTLLSRIPGTVQPQTGDAYARLGAPTGASIAADLAEIEAETDTIPTAAAISTQVWTEPIPGAFAAGSAGAKLNSASAAGDPWATALPGAYGAGTGGSILGNLVASIWNAVAASYNAAGSLGQKLNAAGGAADPLTNAVPGTYAAGSAGYVLGTLPTGNGAIEWTYTLTRSDNGLPIAGATIEISSDAAGTTRLAGPLVTNSLGQIMAYLPAGTVYVWRQANGFSFINPQIQVVS